MDEAVQQALERDRTIDITTTGRNTGQPRRKEIWFHNIEGRLYITGTPGSRDWYANLVANPQFTFHLKQSAQADLINVPVNVRDSLRTRSQAGSHLAQWPRDVVTALVAIVGVRFLMQYADKIAPGHEATSGLWGHLTALAIVILVFEAISLWRSAGRAGQGSPGRPDCSAGAGKETVIAANDQDHLPG